MRGAAFLKLAGGFNEDVARGGGEDGLIISSLTLTFIISTVHYAMVSLLTLFHYPPYIISYSDIAYCSPTRSLFVFI